MPVIDFNLVFCGWQNCLIYLQKIDEFEIANRIMYKWNKICDKCIIHQEKYKPKRDIYNLFKTEESNFFLLKEEDV